MKDEIEIRLVPEDLEAKLDAAARACGDTDSIKLWVGFDVRNGHLYAAMSRDDTGCTVARERLHAATLIDYAQYEKDGEVYLNGIAANLERIAKRLRREAKIYYEDEPGSDVAL